MAELIDMSAPVTRGELREELTVVRSELREELTVVRSELREELTVARSELREELAVVRTEVRGEFKLVREEISQLRTEARANLEIWGGALFARIEARFDLCATRKDMEGGFDELRKDMLAMEQRLGIDLARHVKAIQESLSVQVSVVDEKYADLPDRVTRLESKP
jgi:hypothetical protein